MDAGDAGGIVGREEEDGLRDVARPELLGQRLGVDALALVLAVLDRAGADGVDGDVVGAELAGEAWVMPIRPNFAALWATTLASPRMPWMDDDVDDAAAPALDHAGAAPPGRSSRLPVRLVAMTRSQSSGESFRNGRQMKMPALLTRTSIGPELVLGARDALLGRAARP